MFISTPRFHRGRDSVRECNNEKRNLYKHNNEYPPSVPLLYKYENPQHTYVQALLRSLLSFQLWPWAQRGAAATTALHAATGALQQGGWQSRESEKREKNNRRHHPPDLPTSITTQPKNTLPFPPPKHLESKSKARWKNTHAPVIGKQKLNFEFGDETITYKLLGKLNRRTAVLQATYRENGGSSKKWLKEPRFLDECLGNRKIS